MYKQLSITGKIVRQGPHQNSVLSSHHLSKRCPSNTVNQCTKTMQLKVIYNCMYKPLTNQLHIKLLLHTANVYHVQTTLKPWLKQC